jgi:hypothetical protein
MHKKIDLRDIFILDFFCLLAHVLILQFAKSFKQQEKNCV